MSFTQRLKRDSLLFLKLLLLITVAGFSFYSSNAKAETISFNLIDQNGPVTHESYPGKYLLLSIGYTSCPDICPTTLYEYGYALKRMQHADRLQPLFLTIDPVNDEVNRLNAYTQYFDERIVGLSGEMSDIEDIAKQLGATFGYRLNGRRIDEPVPGLGYEVYHSAMIYLITPERELLDVFDYQIGGDDLVEVLDDHLGKATDSKADIDTAHASDTTVAVPVASNTSQTNCPLPDGFSETKNQAHLTDLNLAIDAKPGAQLVNLWALWCAPCRQELPILEEWASTQPQLEIITINVGDSLDKIDQLFTEQGFSHLPMHQTEGFDLLRQLGGMGLPFNALFVDGDIAGIKSGIITETSSLDHYAQCIQSQTQL